MTTCHKSPGTRCGRATAISASSGPSTIEEAVHHHNFHGVEVEAGPLDANGPLGRDGRHVYFRDPDGSLLEFVSYA